MDEPVRTLQWKELSGEERYRVVEMARKGEVALSELCRTFGVSRQTLYRAMEAADRASAQALEPKKRGRKAKPEDPLAGRVAELEKENERLRKRLKKAETILSVQKKLSEVLEVPLKPEESDEDA